MRRSLACMCSFGGTRQARQGIAAHMCQCVYGAADRGVLATGLLVETWREPPVFISYCMTPPAKMPVCMLLDHSRLSIAQLHSFAYPTSLLHCGRLNFSTLCACLKVDSMCLKSYRHSKHSHYLFLSCVPYLLFRVLPVIGLAVAKYHASTTLLCH